MHPGTLAPSRRRFIGSSLVIGGLAVLIAAGGAEAAPEEVNDAHIGIPVLAPQIPVGPEPYPGSPKKGTCTAGVIGRPCVTDAQCGFGYVI